MMIRNADRASMPAKVTVRGAMRAGYEEILSVEAVHFVAGLARRFADPVHALLARRHRRQAGINDRGHDPAASGAVRTSDWAVATLPDGLRNRQVEIVGPGGVSADGAEAETPTWDDAMSLQLRLRDAVAEASDATLMVRPRGWHLFEENFVVDGRPVPAALFDFGLYLFHNAGRLLAGGSGPYFCLPELECRYEARLWNGIFLHAQAMLDLPRGAIKAMVLIETLPAAREMDEILYELRDHSAGLGCGRRDGIIQAYAQLLIRTCHRRRAHGLLRSPEPAVFVPAEVRS